MCGIFAHYAYRIDLTAQEVCDLLLHGLSTLEFRGLVCDSAGLCIDSLDATSYEEGVQNLRSTAPYVAARAVGKVSELKQQVDQCITSDHLDLSTVNKYHCSLAHTRWATHGPVAVRNAHPVASDPCNGFTVVHNGMIENNKSLREFLSREGETFATDTDTEAFAKLLSLLHRKQGEGYSFQKLVRAALQEIHGAYAMVITSKHYPGEMIACKRGGPLMFAVKQCDEHEPVPYNRGSFRSLTSKDVFAQSAYLECIVSSDMHALSRHARDACALEDGDIVHFRGAGWTISNDSDQDDAGACQE